MKKKSYSRYIFLSFSLGDISSPAQAFRIKEYTVPVCRLSYVYFSLFPTSSQEPLDQFN